MAPLMSSRSCVANVARCIPLRGLKGGCNACNAYAPVATVSNATLATPATFATVADMRPPDFEERAALAAECKSMWGIQQTALFQVPIYSGGRCA